jgi:hypothetical protein
LVASAGDDKGEDDGMGCAAHVWVRFFAALRMTGGWDLEGAARRAFLAMECPGAKRWLATALQRSLRLTVGAVG